MLLIVRMRFGGRAASQRVNAAMTVLHAIETIVRPGYFAYDRSWIHDMAENRAKNRQSRRIYRYILFSILLSLSVSVFVSSFFGSSVKSVGRFWLGKLAKCMIQGNLRGVEGSEAIGFSHSDFYFVV